MGVFLFGAFSLWEQASVWGWVASDSKFDSFGLKSVAGLGWAVKTYPQFGEMGGIPMKLQLFLRSHALWA